MLSRIIILYIFIVLLLFSSSTYADGELSIKPGKYRITKTTKTNFDTVPATRTVEECITDPTLDPQSILPDKDKCRIKNLKSATNKASFDFSCEKSGEKSALKGHAEYSTQGNTILYEFRLEGSYKGRDLIVEI